MEQKIATEATIDSIQSFQIHNVYTFVGTDLTENEVYSSVALQVFFSLEK